MKINVTLKKEFFEIVGMKNSIGQKNSSLFVKRIDDKTSKNNKSYRTHFK